MEPIIINELTSLALELIPESTIDLKSFFEQYDNFSDVTNCEQEGDWIFLTHKDENPKFRIEYNLEEIRISIANTNQVTELMDCIKKISTIDSFKSIELVFKTAFRFDKDLARKEFFKEIYAPQSLLSNNDKEPFYNFKELLFEDDYKFLLNIFEDDLETSEKKEIPAILFSLQCSPKENKTFKFPIASDLLRTKINEIFKKMKTDYSI